MTFGSDAGADPYVPGHGDLGFDVTHYDLTLEYDVEGNRLSGSARIDCVAREELHELTLDLHALEVSKVTLAGHATKYRVKRDKVLVRPADAITVNEEFTVAVRYS